MNQFKRARLLSGKRQIDVFNQTGIWPARLSMIENSLVWPKGDEIRQLEALFNLNPDDQLDSARCANG